MHATFKNSGLARLYLWVTKAKYTMGIFFVAFVVVYLFFGLVSEGALVTLDFFTALEMVFACFFIGLLQQIIIPMGRLNRSRCALWIVSGVLITLVFSLVFRWFERFPLWCFILFMIFMALGMGAIILGYYLELNRETQRLNRGLEQFQQQKSKKEI
jgi:hypothetical protein